ncbi:hypothetical protein [Parvularcula maris]|uniref:VPLPA-CTERM sorting domain-containing protein n=1 Tax=Parvularcula maris TaxID=2965077 RepID=A0A9X2LAS9_9PROT|nr:hypothetical protein [Parvularcula maris]MCQ8186290.1 hypothetical protein [Parvularcula maris]
MIKFAFAAAAISLASLSAASAAIMYDEAIDGDISGTTVLALNLGLGTNVVTGTVTANLDGETDADLFQIFGLEDFAITSATFVATVEGTEGGFVNSNAIPVISGGTLQDLLGAGISRTLDLSTLATALILVDAQGLPPGSDFPRVVSYTLTINAAPVPVPAAGLLFASALAGGIAARRRRRPLPQPA